ncbi:hypothetical protein L7F22_060951 [Adiantum nelumboides]|nr:hypothetical protein [Adiantum nelumboides]
MFGTSSFGLCQKHNKMREEELRSAAHSMIDSLPHEKLVEIAASLPLLQIRPCGDQPKKLSRDQVRNCFHRIADIISLNKIMRTIGHHGFSCTSPSWDEQLTLDELKDELEFAIQLTNDFKGKIKADGFKRRDLDSLYRAGYAAINFVGNVVNSMRTTDLMGSYEERAELLKRCPLQPPDALRLIDVEATCTNGEVYLVEYDGRKPDRVGFTAISHTYGMDVYNIFDCQCTAQFSGATTNPRCQVGACSHNDMVCVEGNQKRDRVVNDILRMCLVLKRAGVHFAWHDGVCIAQHDEAEVIATIKGIGWVYAYAEETIIFLHYVGRPIAILSPGDLMRRLSLDELLPRWHTRAWTLQEAALSANRRYCVRVGSSPLGECHSLEEFEKKVGLWYNDDTSSIEVVEEVRLLDMLVEAVNVIRPLYLEFTKKLETQYMQDTDESNWILLYQQIWGEMKASEWHKSLITVLKSLVTCFHFPTPPRALMGISQRNSKHVGDRINSILALSGVRDFVAPKDDNMEESTIEFFTRQGQRGLQTALFAVNTSKIDDVVNRTWIPCLWKALDIPNVFVHENIAEEYFQYKVLDNGKLEVTGEMVCVKVDFELNVQFVSLDTTENDDYTASQQQMIESVLSNPSEGSERLAKDMRDALDQYRQYVIATVLEGYSGEPSGLLIIYMCTLLEYFTILSTPEPIHRASVVEAIGSDQESSISIGLQPQTSEIFSAVWPHDPWCSFGNVTSPHINVGASDPLAAHLMLPLGCLTTVSSDWPVLIVEGDDLSSPVNKLGFLRPSKLFRACLRAVISNQPTKTTTHLTRIVIN